MGSVTLFQRLCEEPHKEQRWQQFLEYYTPWVKGWAARETRRQDVAEDIVQEVFLRMFQSLGSLHVRTPPGKSLRGWISTVTHNLIREWKRNPHTRRWRQFPHGNEAESGAVRKKLQEEAEDLAERLEASMDDLDKHLVLAEQCERYALAWEALPAHSEMKPSTVLSFLLRVRGQLASEDVAARLGLPSREAVNTNVLRVRVHLAREVGIPKQHARLIDHLDKLARESEACAARLERCAQHYGYPSDA